MAAQALHSLSNLFHDLGLKGPFTLEVPGSERRVVQLSNLDHEIISMPSGILLLWTFGNPSGKRQVVALNGGRRFHFEAVSFRDNAILFSVWVSSAAPGSIIDFHLMTVAQFREAFPPQRIPFHRRILLALQKAFAMRGISARA
ncbi:MAG TPA: hypothetical protein VJC16_00715 [Candidatus Nanoarchaeia archaeon]|nr:hypothetical protein [Candidatus Nanoarchaeia archaeon]